MGFWKSQVIQKSQVTSRRRVTWQDFCIMRDCQIALQNSTAEVMLSWSAVVSIAGCQNQIKRN